MNCFRRSAPLLLLLIAVVAVPGSRPAAAQTATADGSIWFTGATIHPVDAPEIPHGTLEVRAGRIVALGDNLTPPSGARIVDLSGKHLYPGFVHPNSPLGLREIGSVRGTVDNTEIGSNNAHLRAEVAFNADSLLLAPAIGGGVLTAHVAASGGLVSPASAVMTLSGWNWREMVVRSRAAVFVDFPQVVFDKPDAEASEREEFEKSRKAKLADLDGIFDRARAYRAAISAAAGAKAARVDLDAASEALSDLLDGTVPVFLKATERRQIAAALDWAERQKLPRIVLVSGADAVDFAGRLAKSSIPVLLEEVLTLPSRATDPYDAPYAAAGILHAAGVRVAIGDGADASNARNLPFQAAMAAAFGLPRDEALRAVTLTPAELTGVADRVGSLAPGKEASFFVASGDPLEITTAIERVFIRGEEVDLERDRQRQLWLRYAARPAVQ